MAFDIQKTNIEITAIDKTKVAFESVRANLMGLTGNLGALTGLLGVGAFVAFTKRIIDQADSMNDLSKRTGIAVEQIGAWRLATEQSGTSMDALTQALGKGAKYLVQHGDDLKKIGINAKTSEELILQLSGIISQMPADDPRRTALAMQVLGKSAGELIPLLSEGEQGLRKMLDRGRELNPITAEMAKNAADFNDNLAVMKLLSSGLFVNLVATTLPSFNTYLKQMQMVVNDGDWMDKLLFFTVGYVPGKIADKTEKPEDQIKRYTNRIIDLKKELKGMPAGWETPREGYLKKELATAEVGLSAQRDRQRGSISPKGRIGGGVSEAALDLFLKPVRTAKTDTVGDRIKELARENAVLATGKTLEDARTIARYQSQGASKSQIDLIMSLTSTQNQYEAAEKASQKTKEDLIKATEGHAEAMLKLSDASFDLVKNAQDEAAAQERNVQIMQLGESAVIRMDAARLSEAAASAEQGLAYARLNGLSAENIGFVETEILRIKQLAAERLRLANGKDAETAFEKEKQRIEDLQKAQDDAFKQTEQDAKRTADSIYNSISDSIVRSLEKGDGSFKSFLKGLQNTAKTAIIRIGIDFFANMSGLTGLINQVARMVSGAGSAAGGATGAATKATGLFGGLKDILTSGNNSIVSSIASLGQTISEFGSTGTGFITDMASRLGSWTQLNASLISKALPYAGAILQLLKGDFKGAIFQGAGVAIGNFFGGPIGGAIGGFLGKALGGLFGGKKKPRFGTYRAGEYEDGVFTATKARQLYKPLGAEKQLDSLSETFARTLGGFLKSFGLNDSVSTKAALIQKQKASYGQFSAIFDGGSIKGDVKGSAKTTQKTFEQFVEKVLGDTLAKAIQASSLSSGIKKFFNGLIKKEDVLDAMNTLAGLNSSLKDLPPIFNAIKNAIDTTSYQTSIAGLKAQFSAIGTYTNLFYTPQEQFATFTKQLSSQLASLDTPLLKTRDEYRKLVDGINVTDESSRGLFNGLISLAPAMDSYFKQLEEQKAQVDALTDSLRDMNSFTSLAEYRAYKGVAGNYGTSFALDYSANARTGSIAANDSGKASADGNFDLVKLLTEIRDYAKQNLIQSSDGTSLLQRFDRVGMPARA